MFNIVRRRDFMLAQDLPTKEDAEKLLAEKYGRDHIVVETPEPTETQPAINQVEFVRAELTG
jgi:hypothetical protein